MDIMDERDLVSIRIDEKLNTLADASSKPSIFKVHEQLRKENEGAYEPAIVSIGPYHCGKARLGVMEDQKSRFLKQVLNRNSDGNAGRYITAMRKLEERARKCYADDIGDLDSDKFVQMMVLDSCFIVEILRNWKSIVLATDEQQHVSNTSCNIDPTFELRHNRILIRRDLILFENQLPLFVVKEFLNLSTMLGSEEDIILMAVIFLPTLNRVPFEFISNGSTINLENVKHLLDLYNQSLCFPFASRGLETAGSWIEENIKSVTELEEAGVQFKPVDRTLIHLSFKNGILEIPTLMVEDNTEAILRNLVAYEQYLPDTEPQNFTDYIFFLDRLVNTSKDVKILCQHRIILNHLGDDVELATIINRLGNNVNIGKKFNYSILFEEANKHCNRRWNKWMATLRHTYFNTPWALISFLAAVFLLLLTVVQTVFTILSYKGPA